MLASVAAGVGAVCTATVTFLPMIQEHKAIPPGIAARVPVYCLAVGLSGIALNTFSEHLSKYTSSRIKEVKSRTELANEEIKYHHAQKELHVLRATEMSLNTSPAADKEKVNKEIRLAQFGKADVDREIALAQKNSANEKRQHPNP